MDKKDRVLADDDAGFVSRCQKGDSDAFEVLVTRHQKKMLNIVYRITVITMMPAKLSRRHSFQPIVQLKIQGDAKFSTWLTGIMVNHAKNRLRQTQSRSYHEIVSIDDPVETNPVN